MKPFDSEVPESDLPEECFPESILQAAATLHISPGFVESCLKATLTDRARIEAEAAKVEEIQFPAELLAAYHLPPTDPDFVSRVHREVLVDRLAHRAQWRRLLHTYHIPEPSRDFVRRTLTALTPIGAPLPTDSQGVRAGAASPGRNVFWGRRAVAAAAAVLLAVALNFALIRSELPESASASMRVSAQDFSPVPWGTALERPGIARSRGAGLRFEAISGLQVFNLARRTEDD